MTKLKLIKGARRELGYQLLHAIFTAGGNITAVALKQRLAPRGKETRLEPWAPSPHPWSANHRLLPSRSTMGTERNSYYRLVG